MKDQIKDDCFYIFVNLNADKMVMPYFYICTSAEAKERVKQYETRDIIDLSSLNHGGFKDKWEKLEQIASEL
jgi:hypothetical protein